MLTPTDYPADSSVAEETLTPMVELRGPAERANVPETGAADDSPRLDHLRALEAESLHIIRRSWQSSPGR